MAKEVALNLLASELWPTELQHWKGKRSGFPQYHHNNGGKCRPAVFCTRFSLIHHLKTHLALVWLLTSRKNRAIEYITSSILPGLQPGDHHGNSCSSLIQCTATHQLGLDFLKEHDSGLALSSFIPIGLFWQSCNYRGIHPLDSLPALFPVSFARKDNLPFRVPSVSRGCPDRITHPVPHLDPEEFGKMRLFFGD